MASNPLQELKKTLGAGARSNKFKIIIPLPVGAIKDENSSTSRIISTLVKTTSLPTKAFTDIDIFIHGKRISIPGDVTFQDTITCSFLDTEGHKLRSTFDDWMKFIDTFQNKRSANGIRSFTTDIKIQQLSTIDNSVQKEYTLKIAYPKELGTVSFDQANPELTSFDVTFKFSHWE